MKLVLGDILDRDIFKKKYLKFLIEKEVENKSYLAGIKKMRTKWNNESILEGQKRERKRK